jgi:thioredoxin-related protein
MKRIKNSLTTIFLLLCLSTTAQSIEEVKLTWHTDLKKAQEISMTTGKPLFAFFTGSDWCLWCKKLQKNVFLKQEFIQWAEQNVVLLELDFPRNKTQSTELVQQNRRLQQDFGVSGYPTVWIFFLHKKEDKEGFEIERLGTLGYPSGPASEKELIFLEEATEIIRNRTGK